MTPGTTSRSAAAVLVLGGAALAAVATTRPWVSVDPGAAAAGPVRASGRDAAPAVFAVALAAAAAAVVLGTSGRRLRAAVAVGSLLAGAGLVAAAAGVVADPDAAVRPVLERSTGVSDLPGGVAGRASAGGWPWAAGLGGALVMAGGAVGVIRGRTWPGPAARLELAAPAAAPQDDGGRSAWDALSRGDDPTDHGERPSDRVDGAGT